MSRKMQQASGPSLADALDARTVEGELYERLDGQKLRCYACGHRCLIPEGRRGICKVRFNRDGTLYVPWGYAAGVQCDPTEKKPFFHVYPGSNTLTFGMLGCDLHCSYCFPADTPVITNRGVMPIQRAFEMGGRRLRLRGGDVSAPHGLSVPTSDGNLRPVRQVFRHPYGGRLTIINPYYFLPLRCTPDHRLLICRDLQTRKIEPIAAHEITDTDYLVIPKRYSTPNESQTLDVLSLLFEYRTSFRTPRSLTGEEVAEIMAETRNGISSRELGNRFGKDPSYIRHVCSQVRRGAWKEEKTEGLIQDGDFVRFPKEHRPGIPASIPVNRDLAELLGYYCAEGCVVSSKNRPNSHTLNLSFSPTESKIADRVRGLIEKVFGIRATIVRRSTTLALSIGKASPGLLFRELCGARSTEKRIPRALMNADNEIISAFVNAYATGDGHQYPNGKITTTTVSAPFAQDLVWLLLRLGYLPSLYKKDLPHIGTIEGRTVSQALSQYTVVWYTSNAVRRKHLETPEYYLIPIRSVGTEDFSGYVYNMEVEQIHDYMAGFFLVKNCQNWLTSQALRDPEATISPREISADALVDTGLRQGAMMVASSYNEPLITSEWALEVFKRARSRGLKTAFVSNGNATAEVLDYLRPWTDAYKIDLKTMSDRNYRKLGGVLQNVLDTIRMVYERGFWMEIVTLLVPGWNTSDEELAEAARFLSGISPDIPWHVTAFHKDYRMTEPDNTSVRHLLRAAEIGREAGLRFVYAGNLPGAVSNFEGTYCPGCGTLLIERYGFRVLRSSIGPDGACPQCARAIPGIWGHVPRPGNGFIRPMRF